MDFKNRIKENLKQQILTHARQSLKFYAEEYKINNSRSYENAWNKVLNLIEDFIRNYLEQNTHFTVEQATELNNKFLESVSNESLNLMKEGIELTEDEERNIMYEESRICAYDKIDAISEILLRRKLREFLDEFIGLQEAIEMLKEEPQTRENQYLYKLITGEIFKSEEQWQKRIEEEAERNFNQRINCGGYALELDTCVFNYSADFEKAVSELLDKVPFIRLLGDKKLADDEYLVLWKVREGGGHHFVKVEEDGTITEKYECKPIKLFKGWTKSIKDCPEAVLAVKKEHDIYLYNEFSYIDINGKSGKNFEETVQQAIQNQSNCFEYHNHSYYFKKDEAGKVYICSDGRIIADVFTENGECLVDIAKSEKRYVSNTQPPVPLCIKDGKVQKSALGIDNSQIPQSNDIEK